VSVELVRRSLAFTNGPLDVSDDELAETFAPDVVLDMSARVFNPKVYEGYDGLRQFRRDAEEVWETLKISETELIEEGDHILVLTHVEAHGRGSGIQMDVQGAGIWTVANGRLQRYRLLSPGVVDREEALATLRDQAGM
jgi:ketosteroid isomerase-like protein